MIDYPQQDYDSPWKEAIEKYFPDFMRFFFSDIYVEIDWQKRYEFLDKDLEKITQDAAIGRRYADKLVKIYTLTGKIKWAMIHIEVQANREANFAERIYVYNHRIWQQYHIDVASLVILCDDEINYRPNQYQREVWGCQSSFEFPICKLLDYRSRWHKLEEDINPFSIVTMAQLKAKEIKDAGQLKDWKFQITKALYERKYSKSDILALYRFVDWLITLPEIQKQQYDRQLAEYEKEKTMRYVTQIERSSKQEGRQEGEAALLMRLLKIKFGLLDNDVTARIENADSDQLLSWSEKVLTAQSVDEVFGVF
jgi:hypothetical protein